MIIQLNNNQKPNNYEKTMLIIFPTVLLHHGSAKRGLGCRKR